MNVYDFDGTIYKGDSSIDFYLFSLKKNFTIIRFFPIQLLGIVLYKLSKVDKTKMKSMFFSFLNGIKNIDSEVEFFWDKNSKKIKHWYIERKLTTDIIISASPEFLIKAICNRIEVNNVIGSRVNERTGLFTGLNCFGEEKVKRLLNEYKGIYIDEFYSDSESDTPLAQKANRAFVVKDDKIIEWRIK